MTNQLTFVQTLLYSWCLLMLATWLLYTITLPKQEVPSAVVDRQYLATAPGDTKR